MVSLLLFIFHSKTLFFHLRGVVIFLFFLFCCHWDNVHGSGISDTSQSQINKHYFHKTQYKCDFIKEDNNTWFHIMKAETFKSEIPKNNRGGAPNIASRKYYNVHWDYEVHKSIIQPSSHETNKLLWSGNIRCLRLKCV